jgi:hypothetical protein
MIYEQATGRDLRVQEEDTVTNEGPFPVLQRDYRGQRLREFLFLSWLRLYTPTTLFDYNV